MQASITKTFFYCELNRRPIRMCSIKVNSFLFILSLVGVVSCIEIFKPLENFKNCFPLRNTTICEFWISDKSSSNKDLDINCLPPFGNQKQSSIRIKGEFHVLKINCTAQFPVDFIYYGTQPSEAMFIEWSKQIIPNDLLENQNYTVEVQIYSNQALFEYFNNPKNSYYENPNEGLPLAKHIYSRSGNYSFPGIFNKNLGTWFYLFLEDSEEPSFLRNNRTITVDIKDVENKLYWSIPCVPSHFGSRVLGMGPNGLLSNDLWNPIDGFIISIQDPVGNNNSFDGIYNCSLIDSSNGIILDTITYNYTTGVDQENIFIPVLAKNTDQIEITGQTPSTPTNYVNYIFPICKTKDPLFSVDPEQVQMISVPSPNFGSMRHVQHFALPRFVNKSYTAKITVPGWDPLIRELIQRNGVNQRMGTVYCSVGDATKISDFGSAIKIGVLVPFNFGLDWAQFNRKTSGITIHFGIRSLGNDKNLYINSLVNFECRVNVPVLVKPVVWYLKFKNGSLIQDFIDYNLDYDTSIRKINISHDLDSIQCASSYWYSDFWRNITLDVAAIAKNATPPIVFLAKEYKFQLGSVSNIPCTAKGDPTPLIWFEKDGKQVGLDTVKDGNKTLLIFPNVEKSQQGTYFCVARNLYMTKQKFKVVVEDEGFSNTDLILVILIPVIICIATLLGSYIYIKYYKVEKTGLTKQEVEDFVKGLSKEEAQLTPAAGGDGNDYVQAHEFALMRPYVKDYEVIPKRFTVDESTVLGKGQFGLVLLGSVDKRPVAVKTVQRNADKQYLKALLSELKIMIHLGQHEHLVPLIGACTKDLRRGFVYVFVKYLEHGNLQSYLRNNKPHYCPSLSRSTLGSEFNKGQDIRVFGPLDLNLWCLQIANGMEFLASKNVIHGDLAARNVLIDEFKAAKVTDFGLSRQLYEYNDYIKKNQEPLPWRWMAPESLKFMSFSKFSDVWAYGVTLWEILSLGEVPYPGYSWNLDFIDDLDNGLRMGKPKYANDKQFELIYDCWNVEPLKRPSFTDIKIKIDVIKKSFEEASESNELIDEGGPDVAINLQDPLGAKNITLDPNKVYQNVANTIYLNL